MKHGPPDLHFYHIPRTGGFSVYKFFKQMNADRVKQGKKFIVLGNNGHTPWKAKDVPTFTFLRDPVIHVCSTYTYIRSHGAHKGSKFARERTLSQWLRDVKSIGSFVKFFDRPTGSLEIAIEHAAVTDFIGFTDRFNDDMTEMLKTFKLGVKYNNQRHNFSGRRAEPSKEDIKFIRKVRAEDYELLHSIIKTRNLKPIKFL